MVSAVQDRKKFTPTVEFGTKRHAPVENTAWPQDVLISLKLSKQFRIVWWEARAVKIWTWGCEAREGLLAACRHLLVLGLNAGASPVVCPNHGCQQNRFEKRPVCHGLFFPTRYYNPAPCWESIHVFVIPGMVRGRGIAWEDHRWMFVVLALAACWTGCVLITNALIFPSPSDHGVFDTLACTRA